MTEDSLNVRGDTRAATWARVARRLRLDADKLRGFGFIVIEPPNLDTHPDFRQPPGDQGIQQL